MTTPRISDAWVLDRIDTIYPAYRVAFERLLVTLRSDFGGDLDAMLVLLTVSLGTDRPMWREALFGVAEPVVQTRLTNTPSIPQTTGIPRGNRAPQACGAGGKGMGPARCKGQPGAAARGRRGFARQLGPENLFPDGHAVGRHAGRPPDNRKDPATRAVIDVPIMGARPVGIGGKAAMVEWPSWGCRCVFAGVVQPLRCLARF
jgi:hypothetical protein